MKTVAIIQARMASQRLPGKALKYIGEREILDWVIHRVSMIRGVDEVVVATSDLDGDDIIAIFCAANDIPCFRGSADDVLERYYVAATNTQADIILRVTADCPLLCPELNSQILSGLRGSECWYASMPTDSNGFVQEAFRFDALRSAYIQAKTDDEREHVVPWMLDYLKTHWVQEPEWLTSLRCCVDTQGDLDFLREWYAEDPNLFDLPARDLVGLVASVP